MPCFHSLSAGHASSRLIGMYPNLIDRRPNARLEKRHADPSSFADRQGFPSALPLSIRRTNACARTKPIAVIETPRKDSGAMSVLVFCISHPSCQPKYTAGLCLAHADCFRISRCQGVAASDRATFSVCAPSISIEQPNRRIPRIEVSVSTHAAVGPNTPIDRRWVGANAGLRPNGESAIGDRWARA